MTDLLAGVDDLVDKLKTITYKGNPLRVTTKLEDVNPPCVWLAIESLDHYNFGGELLLRLFLIAGGGLDEYRAIKALSPMLDEVLGIVSPAEVTTVVTVPVLSTRKALPALRVTTSLTI